eukprot:Hpha_TRINITY_DN15865_c4_g5::TRINITY_DN15865_c4_g5_i1::g.188348::m.188348/K01190/lacZ; beta-galactosidase
MGVPVLALWAAAAAPGRTVVPFGYAWRFHYGDDPSSPPESGPKSCSTAFETSLQDYSICEGMERNPNRFSEKDCRMACCYDSTCVAWQAFPLALGRQCYHAYKGMNITCSKPTKPTGMGGGRRSPPEPPFFRTDYSFAADAESGVDASWKVVDAPHDFIAENAQFTNNIENFKQGYLPRNASWYRKHFRLPADWQGEGETFLHFEGVFHHSTIFLNGKYIQQHEAGYTPFTVRLDNATGVRFGGDTNVIALRADASFGSGHWYEGGGIYRPVSLVHVGSNATHIVRDGLFVTPESDGSSVACSLELEAPRAAVSARFTLIDTDGTTTLATASTPASTKTAFRATLSPPKRLRPWSIRDPVLYTVRAEVFLGSGSGDAIDVVSTSVGFRTSSWKDEAGVKLNGDLLKLRGFSHHNSIGGLGVAIPERINLFRVQAARALGSNIWRMSHNPYTPHLYTLLDITGVLCWDENRDYGAKYMGGAYARQMHDMVKRDRNHPSIIVWSFCNEYECNQNDPDYTAKAYREAALSADPDRPVAANDATFGSPMYLDVQGCSHSKNNTFEKLHSSTSLPPNQPLVLSECCSCTSQRPDRSLPSCIAEQNSPGLLPYVAGSLGVWTLMDYFGEPKGTGTSGWPHVSSDFGQFDIAGFPKPHAYWYSANWLQGFSPTDPGRPPLPTRDVARVLSLPETAAGSIAAITTAPFAELIVDGKSQGGVMPTPLNDLGEFDQLTFQLGAGAQCGDDAGSFPHNASKVQCKGLKSASTATTAATTSPPVSWFIVVLE